MLLHLADEAHAFVTDISIAYGMTETSPVSFQTALNDPIDRRVGTVGRVQPQLQVKTVDADGETTERGVAGELCTRGYSVMHGYRDDPEKTAEAIDRDGWMHTGDLALIDAEGYCQIVGRLKDDHSRRRKHFAARDRGVPLPPPEDRARPDRRRARPEVR